MLSQLLPCKWTYGLYIKMLSDRRLSIAVRIYSTVIADARIRVLFCFLHVQVDGKEIKNGSVLDSTNHVNVAVVNSEIYKNGSGTAIQPCVVFEVTDCRFRVDFILWKIEIKSTGSVGRDFALIEHALSLRSVTIHPSVHTEKEFQISNN